MSRCPRVRRRGPEIPGPSSEHWLAVPIDEEAADFNLDGMADVLWLNPQTNRQEKVGGVKYTIKDGIVYDAQKLLAEVAAAVAEQKRTIKPATTSEP